MPSDTSTNESDSADAVAPDDGDAQTDADSNGDDQTTSTETRWWATNDVLAGWLLATAPVLIGAGAFGVLELASVPQLWTWTWVLLASAAGTWAFGVDLIKQVSG